MACARRKRFVAFLVAAGSMIALALISASRPARTEEEPTMSKLTLKSKTLLDQDSPLRNARYAHPTGLEMIGPKGYSPDNGRTWTPMKPTPDFRTDLPHGYRREPSPPWLDPVNGSILTPVDATDTPDLDPKISEPPVLMEAYYMRYRVSVDGGRTYLFDERIIQKGDYTPEHPIEDVLVGKNAFFQGDLGMRPIRLQNGNILVPAQSSVLGTDGKLTYPGGGYYWLDTIVLIGTWVEDNRIEWDVSERIMGDPDRTARGLYEGTLAEMPDGRILLVMRGSNAGKKDPNYEWPSYKWYSVSSDGGKHWTKPEGWTYSEGSHFFSPASTSYLLTHSNGRTYWIGNLSPQNCRANNPRWPLVIGEVDPESLMLIKDSVIIIDTKQPDEEDAYFSHFLAFEDRETHDIIVPMRRGLKPSQPVLYVIGVE